MIDNFLKEEIERMQSRIEFFNEVASVISEKNDIIRELEEELYDMKLKYLNALAIQKQLKVIEYGEFYNLLGEDEKFIYYNDTDIDGWIITFKEAEELIKNY